MNRDGINLDEISYRGILMDLLKNVWMIILTAAAVWLGCTGVGKLLYQPQYTASSYPCCYCNGQQQCLFLPVYGHTDGRRFQRSVSKQCPSFAD